MGQHIDEFGIAVVLFQEPFEKREPAICKANGLQQGFFDPRHVGTLLHHGRQLLVVAYHHKLADSRTVIVGLGREQR